MAKVSAKGLSLLHGGESLIPSKVYNAVLGAASVDFRFDKFYFKKALPPITFTFNGEVIFSRTKEDMMLESKTALQEFDAELKDTLHNSLSKPL